MGGLIEDMLSLTGLKNRTRTIKKESVEPDTFLLNLYEQMEPLAKEKGLTLTIKKSCCTITGRLLWKILQAGAVPLPVFSLVILSG